MLLVISPSGLGPEQILSSSLEFSREWQSAENASWGKGELARQPTLCVNLLVSWKHDVVHCSNLMTQMIPRCKNQDGLLSWGPQPWSQKDTHSQYLHDPEKLVWPEEPVPKASWLLSLSACLWIISLLCMTYVGQRLSCRTGLRQVRKLCPRLTGKLPFRILLSARQGDLQSHFKIWEDTPNTMKRQARSQKQNSCTLQASSPFSRMWDWHAEIQTQEKTFGRWHPAKAGLCIPKLTLTKPPLILLLITFNSDLIIAFYIHVTSIDWVTLSQVAPNKILFCYKTWI